MEPIARNYSGVAVSNQTGKLFGLFSLIVAMVLACVALVAPQLAYADTADTADKTQFAVYSEPDGSLNFYNRGPVPSAGETFDGKVVTAVYTEFSTATVVQTPASTSYSYTPAWSDYRGSIKSVSVVDKVVAPDSLTFKSLGVCESMDLANLDTSNMTSMASMFDCCVSLTSLDLSSFDTSKVTEMSGMFNSCEQLSSLDVLSFDTSKVTSMYWMFDGCSSLTNLDLSSFDTSKINVSSGGARMFERSALRKLIVGDGWTLSKDDILLPADAVIIRKGAGNSSTAGVSIYCLYNKYSGEHLFTSDASEYASLVKLGWKKEGASWAAPTSGTAVYRLYNTYNGEHLYTTKKSEYNSLAKIGWKKEGVAFYSADSASGTAIYRLYNPYVTVGTHLYTTSASEYKSLQKLGWKGEGEALYGAK